jgi:AraC-like DNA-binding protein
MDVLAVRAHDGGAIYLALVPRWRHVALAAAASPHARYVAALDAAHFLATLETHDIGVAILDPERLSAIEPAQRGRLLDRLGTDGWTVLYDVAQTAEGFRALLSAAKARCPLDVILRPRSGELGPPSGDAPERVQHMLALGASENLGMQIVRHLAEHFSSLSWELGAVLVGILLGKIHPAQAADIARLSGRSKSSIQRELSEAGLVGASHFVVAARVVRALPNLRDPDVTLITIARKHGFGGRPTVHREVDAAAGLDVDAIRSCALPLHDIVYRTANRLLAREDADSAG